MCDLARELLYTLKFDVNVFPSKRALPNCSISTVKARVIREIFENKKRLAQEIWIATIRTYMSRLCIS